MTDVNIALKLSCHGTLINTAIAEAQSQAPIVSAMREAVAAGAKGHLTVRIQRGLLLQRTFNSQHNNCLKPQEWVQVSAIDNVQLNETPTECFFYEP